jgi:hypothetical protein
LSNISGLFVIARNSSFTLKGKSVHVGEAGKKLGVRGNDEMPSAKYSCSGTAAHVGEWQHGDRGALQV